MESVVGPQHWAFDLARFKNREIPGESRVYDLNNEHHGTHFDKFRWVFYGAPNSSKAFSVQLSGLMLYGSVVI